MVNAPWRVEPTFHGQGVLLVDSLSALYARSMNHEPIIHPEACCETESIGGGTRVWAGAHILRGAKIGRDCNIGENVFIENHVSIGDGCTIKNSVAIWDKVTLADGVFVGPDAVFTNDLRPRAFIKKPQEAFHKTEVHRGATIGANATVVCGVTIGEFAMIGAGAVVTKDVPAFSLVLGNPARVRGRVCYCGENLNEKDFCEACQVELTSNPLALTWPKPPPEFRA